MYPAAATAAFDPQRQRRRLLGWLGLILTLAFLTASGLAYWVSSTEVRRSIVDHTLPLTVDSIYAELERDILRPLFVASQMARNTWLRDWAEAGERDPAPLLRYLREVKAHNNAVSSFFVSASTHRYYHPVAPIKTVSEQVPADAWFFRVVNLPGPYEISADPDLMNRRLLTLFINYKVLGSTGQLLGITGVGLSSEGLVRKMRDYEQRFQRRLLLVDEHGTVVLTGNPELTLPGKTRVLPRLDQLPGLGPLAARILSHPGGQTRLSYDTAEGDTVFVNARYLPELRWTLVAEQDESQALAPVRRVLGLTVAIGLLTLLVTMGVVHTVVGRFQRRLELLATTDELSRLPNRRSGERALARAVHQAGDTGQALGLLVLDIDRFKQINDTLGHAAGDHVITEVARRIEAVVRPGDLVARWGGEEFVLVLPGSSAATAHEVAQRVRTAVAHTLIEVPGGRIAVTASLGAAQWQTGEAANALFARADEALLRAKGEGRNRVVMAREAAAALAAAS